MFVYSFMCSITHFNECFKLFFFFSFAVSIFSRYLIGWFFHPLFLVVFFLFPYNCLSFLFLSFFLSRKLRLLLSISCPKRVFLLTKLFQSFCFARECSGKKISRFICKHTSKNFDLFCCYFYTFLLLSKVIDQQ